MGIVTPILELVNAPSAPLRLALGNDAVDNLRAKHAQLAADVRDWEELGRSTALPDQT